MNEPAKYPAISSVQVPPRVWGDARALPPDARGALNAAPQPQNKNEKVLIVPARFDLGAN